MSNYEKLCEAVGIDPCAKCVSQILCCEIDDKHPDFTAEKQIELIKLLMRKGSFAGFTSDTILNSYVICFNLSINQENEDFSAALADLTLQLIKAGELDKDEVRRILE